MNNKTPILILLSFIFFISFSIAVNNNLPNLDNIGEVANTDLPNLKSSVITSTDSTNYSMVNVNNSLYWQGHTGTDGSWLTGIGLNNSFTLDRVFVDSYANLYYGNQTHFNIYLQLNSSGIPYPVDSTIEIFSITSNPINTFSRRFESPVESISIADAFGGTEYIDQFFFCVTINLQTKCTDQVDLPENYLRLVNHSWYTENIISLIGTNSEITYRVNSSTLNTTSNIKYISGNIKATGDLGFESVDSALAFYTVSMQNGIIYIGNKITRLYQSLVDNDIYLETMQNGASLPKAFHIGNSTRKMNLTVHGDTNVNGTLYIKDISMLSYINYSNLAKLNNSNNFIQVLGNTFNGVKVNNLTAFPNNAHKIIARNDTLNTVLDSMVVLPSTNQIRLFFGQSGETWYALNFGSVSNFESVPQRVTQSATTDTLYCLDKTCSVIGNANAGDVVIPTAGNGAWTAQHNSGSLILPIILRSYANATSLYNNYKSVFTFSSNATQNRLGSISHSLWETGGITLMNLTGTGNLIVLNSTTTPLLNVIANKTKATCSVDYGGAIYFDNRTKKHYGCNTTNWVGLY